MNSKSVNRTVFSPSVSGLACLALMLGVVMVATTATANPYATCLTNNAGVISFRLNESADNVKVIWPNPGLVTNDLGPLPKGLTVTNLGVVGLVFKVEVYKQSGPGYLQGVANQINDDTNALVNFANGRGLEVNTRPNSPYFGRIYVACGALGTVSSNAFNLGTGARSTGDGIYALNADQTDAVGQGNTARTGGIDWSLSAEGPGRLDVGEDDNLYITDWSDAHGGIYVTDPNISSTSGTNVLINSANPSGPFPVTSSRIHGSGMGVVALGSLANNNLTVYWVDEDLQLDRDTITKTDLNSIWRFDIGGGPLAYSNWPPVKLFNTLGGFAQYCGLRRGPDGKFYYGDNRADAATASGAFVIDSDGTTLLWESITATRTYLGDPAANDLLNVTRGIGVSPNGTYMATINSTSNSLAILPLTAGVPDMTKLVKLGVIPTTGLGRDVTFDAADNIYSISSGQALLRIYSPGGTTYATTSTDATFNGGQFFALTTVQPSVLVTASASDASAAEAGPDNGEFTISRAGYDNSQPLAVRFTMSGTTANGVDYVLQTNNATMTTNWVIIPAASDTVTISLVPTDDTVAEFTETAVLSLASWTTYGPGNPASATVEITDNEPPELQVTSWDASMYERLTNDCVRMYFTRRGDTNVSVYLDPTNFVCTGVATRNVDYYVTNATVDAGVVNGNARMVYPLNDSLLEGTETFSISMAAAGGLGWTNRPNTNTASIVDDELLPETTILYSENFNSDATSNNWTMRFAANNGVDDYRYLFSYDYASGTMPITAGAFPVLPPAPHSSGDTLGCYLTVNKDEGTDLGAAGINLYPNSQSFSGNYSVRFDMYLMVGAAASTTEYVLFGINHSGNNTNWFRNTAGGVPAGWVFDGLFYGVESDGAALGDYVIYSAPTTAGNNPTALTPGVNASTLTGTFKHPPYGPVRTLPGAPGCDEDSTTPSWSDVQIDKIGSLVRLKINNTTIMTVTNGTAFTVGDIMLGYCDAYDSVMAGNSCVIYDNLRVVRLDGLVITKIENVGANAEVTFSSGIDDPATAFKLQSSTTVGTGYADTAATITRLSAGQYKATIARSGAVRFYRIRYAP